MSITLKQMLDMQAKQQQQILQQQFSYNLPPVILNQSTSGMPQAVDTGLFNGNWIVVSDESPWDINVIQGGINKRIKAGFADKIQTFQRIVYVQPTLLLPQGAPASQIDVEVYPVGEPSGYFPVTLARQSAPVSASVKFGYSTFIEQLGGAGPYQMLNIFNPSNSGKNYIFYSNIVTISSGTAATQILGEILVGPDVNLANNAGAFQHDTNGPASVSHNTFATGSLPSNGVLSAPFNLVTQVGLPTQCLQNGDLVTLHQGNNFLIVANTTTQLLTDNISWWEQ